MHLWMTIFLVLVAFSLGGKIEVCRATTYAYILNTGGKSVSVLRTSDLFTIKSCQTGEAPYGCAVSPGRDYLYVSNQLSDTVSVIDTLTGKVTETITVGTAPKGLATDANGDYLFVANSGDDDVSIIRLNGDDGNEVIATLPMGGNPEGVAADPWGRYMYVSNYADNSISTLTTYETDKTIEVGAGPIGITPDLDRNYIYVANFLEGTVMVIDINGEDTGDDDDDDEDDDEDEDEDAHLEDDNQVIATIPVGNGPWGITIGAWGNNAYVTNSMDNTVSVIDLETMTVTATVDVGKGPKGIAAPRNSDNVYVINQEDETVSVIDTTDNSITTISTGAGTSPVGLGNFISGTIPSAVSSFVEEDDAYTSITLSWMDNSYDEDGFKLYRYMPDDDDDDDDVEDDEEEDDDEFELLTILDPNVTEYTDTGLEKATTYYYSIAAFSEAGDSSAVTISAATEADVVEEDDTVWDSISGGNCFISNTANTASNWWILAGILLLGIFSVRIADDEIVVHIKRRVNRTHR